MTGRRGWTLVELLTAMLVMGVLSSLAILKYIYLTRTAFAAKIAGEFVTVRLAAYNYEADHNNQWPAETGPGTVPAEMAPYLPSGFTFQRTTYDLDWDNLSPSLTPYELAISITTTDPALLQALAQNLGTRAPYYFTNNKLTYVLVDQSGNY